MVTAKTKLATAKFDPTERSNSPAIINIATPTTMMPMMLANDKMLERAPEVRKLGAAMEKKRNTSRKLMTATISENLSSSKRNCANLTARELKMTLLSYSLTKATTHSES
jgi:hypothetical protein